MAELPGLGRWCVWRICALSCALGDTPCGRATHSEGTAGQSKIVRSVRQRKTEQRLLRRRRRRPLLPRQSPTRLWSPALLLRLRWKSLSPLFQKRRGPLQKARSLPRSRRKRHRPLPRPPLRPPRQRRRRPAKPFADRDALHPPGAFRWP